MEPNKRMRSSSDNVGLDRLSVMPDQVIVHILSYMSTRDAVRTMLLRCFGNLWTFIPSLSFDFGDYYVTPVNDNADDGVNGVDDVDNDDDEDDDNDDGDDGEDDDDDDIDDDAEQAIIGEAYLRFFSYVRNVLRLHRRSTIDSFHLYVKDFKNGKLDPSLTSDVHEWLKFATDRGVKDLHVSCNLFCGLTLPSCVFTSQSIVTLTLSGCSFEKYEHQPQLHMGALTSLNLNWLNIIYESNEALNEFISRCTSLQNLDIYCAVGLHDLNITAPNLPRLGVCFLNDPDIPCTLTCPHVKTLNVGFNGSFGSSPYIQLDVIDISSLEVVNLANIPKGPSSTTKAFLRQFRDVEVFTLASQGIEQLCLLEKMQIAKNKWQRMLLEPRWNHERCLDVIIKLVKSSLELEELIIDNGHSSGNCEVVSSEFATSCVIPRLKDVTIRGVCCEGQLQLIEFILRNAVVLEEVVITLELCGCSIHCNPQVNLGSLKRLSLVFVGLHKNALEQFLSGCPSVRELHIENPLWTKKLCCRSPNIERLSLVLDDDAPGDPLSIDFPNLKSLDLDIQYYRVPCIVDVSSLRDIYFRNLEFWGKNDAMLKMFWEKFEGVEVVQFSLKASRQLCLLEKMQIAQNKWQRMLLEPPWNHKRCLDVIIKLVKSSLELEELILDNRHSSGNNGEVVSSESATSCVIPRLKHVTMRGRICEGQLQLIEFIVRNAVVLEEVVIAWEKDFTILEELDFVRRVSQVKRASVNAIVHFD